MNLQFISDTAVAIAREAGALLREGFAAEKQIAYKSSAVDWLTQFDEAAEALIVQRLRVAFPDHGLVGEEGANHTGVNGLVWYIDPLDGTTNFAHGFPVFCVSMALYDGATPLVGVVYDPMREECFVGVKGGGAVVHTAVATVPLRVSQTDTLVQSLIATGFPYDRHTSPHNNVAQLEQFLIRTHGVRRAGAAALDLTYVAAGRLDGYWEFKLNSWDVAAAIVLVLEAGGTVTGMDGCPLPIAPKMDLVVSNGRIHGQMVELLATIPVPVQ